MPLNNSMKKKCKLPLKIQQDTILDGMENGVGRIWRYNKSIEHTKPEYLLTISVADKLSNLNIIPYEEIKIEVEKPTGQVTKAIVIDYFDLTQSFFGSKKKRPTPLRGFEALKRREKIKKRLLNWRHKVIKKSAVSRKGRVDIFASINITATPTEQLIVVEVKREQPEVIKRTKEDSVRRKDEIKRSRTRRSSFEREIKKDIKRLGEFILCGRYSKSDLTGHLTFFTLKKETHKSIKTRFCSQLDQQKISVTVKSKYVEGDLPQLDDIDSDGVEHYCLEGIPYFYVYCISLKLKSASKIF